MTGNERKQLLLVLIHWKMRLAGCSKLEQMIKQTLFAEFFVKLCELAAGCTGLVFAVCVEARFQTSGFTDQISHLFSYVHAIFRFISFCCYQKTIVLNITHHTERMWKKIRERCFWDIKWQYGDNTHTHSHKRTTTTFELKREVLPETTCQSECWWANCFPPSSLGTPQDCL